MRGAARVALALALCACATAKPAFELVESWPIETTLDSPLPDAHRVWLEMLGGARRTIDIAQFYISNGERLEPVINAIEAAMKRGVKVRLLVEQSFVKVYPETIDRLRKAGADVRELDGLHAKYFIVDGREAFLGSQNFDYRALQHILELGVRVRDPAAIASLQAVFEQDWAGTRTSVGRSALTASPDKRLPDGVMWDLPMIVGMIDRAKSRVRLQALTYKAGEWTELEDALVRAKERGVKVEIAVADWSKREKTVGGIQALAKKGIAIYFVTIPAWSGGFIPYARVIHAKVVAVDGEHGWVGTSNFERSYFYDERNVGIVGSGPFARELDMFIERVLESKYASPVDPNATYQPPRIE